MKIDETTCDPTLLNRFLDQELAPDEHARIRNHLKDCPACQKAVRDNQSVTSLFKTGLDEALAHVNLEDMEARVLALIHTRRAPWWMKLRNLCVSKKFYVPATAVAAGLVLFLALVRHPAPVPGPSAIINSFEGDVTSVMILETHKSHQTILWFKEAPMPSGDHGEPQQNHITFRTFSGPWCPMV